MSEMPGIEAPIEGSGILPPPAGTLETLAADQAERDAEAVKRAEAGNAVAQGIIDSMPTAESPAEPVATELAPVEPVVIGPAPGLEGQTEIAKPEATEHVDDAVADYTEVPPMYKHAEVPRIGGPGSEDAADMIAAAARPPEGPRFQM